MCKVFFGNMSHRKRVSEKLKVIKRMPPSYHTLPGQKFDIKKSEVIRWLIDQPEILNHLWDRLKFSGYVEYDPETRLWTGIDYADTCPHGDGWDDCPDCRH